MSDLSSISRLQEEQEKTLKDCEAMIEKWEKFKEDYKAVDKLLNDLPKKTTQDVMVPIGPLAFMPGNLIHTNEIIVLLGDNWFAERSATQASEIAKRRLKSVEEFLDNLHKEHENILSHMAFTTDVVAMQNQKDFQEIKEELTEKDKQRQDKKSMRMAHSKATKNSVKKVDLRNNPSSSGAKSKEDENLFARLEELERREQINNELENEQYFVDSTSCSTDWNDESTRVQNTCTENETDTSLRAGSKTSASSNDKTCSRKERAQTPCTVKERNSSLRTEICSSVSQQENMRATNACNTKSVQNDVDDTCGTIKAKTSNDKDRRRLVKRVSWKENVDKQGDDSVAYPKEKNATIHFTHSTGTVTSRESQEQNIASPADILADYLNKKESTARRPQSAMKGSKDEQIPKDEKSSISEQGENNNTEEKQIIPQPQAFSDVVVEHNTSSTTSATIEKDKEQKTDTRKISKFKARRMKNN